MLNDAIQQTLTLSLAGITEMDEEEINCNVCFEAYDEKAHSPRTLRCGHTVCTPCLDLLVMRSVPDRNCPECRKPLKITASQHLPISYTVLRMSRAITSLSEIRSQFEMQMQLEDGEACITHGLLRDRWCKACDLWMCCKCHCRNGCSVEKLPLAPALLQVKQKYVDDLEDNLERLSEQRGRFEDERKQLERSIKARRDRLEHVEKKIKRITKCIRELEEEEALAVEANSATRITNALRRTKDRIEEMDTWLEENKSDPRVLEEVERTAPRPGKPRLLFEKPLSPAPITFEVIAYLLVVWLPIKLGITRVW